MAQFPTSICRVERSKQAARTNYNRLSKCYDWLEGWAEEKTRDKGLRKLAVREGEIVLEIGFGTGHGILSMARSVGRSGKVYGIDLSDGMLKVTREKVEKENLSDRVVLKRGDAVRLPYDPEYFDAIFTSFTLELFDTPEIPIVLNESQRVLKNNGRICVVALSRSGNHRVIGLYEWFHKKFPEFVDCRPIYVLETLEASGFRILDSTKETIFGLPVEIILGTKLHA